MQAAFGDLSGKRVNYFRVCREPDTIAKVTDYSELESPKAMLPQPCAGQTRDAW